MKETTYWNALKFLYPDISQNMLAACFLLFDRPPGGGLSEEKWPVYVLSTKMPNSSFWSQFSLLGSQGISNYQYTLCGSPCQSLSLVA